jgi:chromate transporter
MERNVKNYLKLFISTFLVSAFTFGGGYVIAPMMKKKFVEELRCIDEEEMLNIIAIAQSSPGAIAVNTSILVGWQLMGILGALVSILGTVLPPLIILSVISLFYSAVRNNTVVNALLKGMMAGVCAVIFDVLISMGSKIVVEKKLLPILLMLFAFLAHYIYRVNVIYIILICGTIGALVSIYESKPERDKPGR